MEAVGLEFNFLTEASTIISKQQDQNTKKMHKPNSPRIGHFFTKSLKLAKNASFNDVIVICKLVSVNS